MKTKFLIILLALIICLGSVGCFGSDDTDNAPNENTDTSTDASEATDVPGTDDTPSSVPAEPVEISTVGGAVIVGVIEKNDSGWCIVPEQPLNVSFEYFLDNPSYFENVTSILLADASVDGIEKSVYLGQTVTVEGSFFFYRDYFDRLYFDIYGISVGKSVEKSHAAPELQRPEKPQNQYDPDRPLPKYLSPMISDGKYAFNTFMLSEETIELMGNDFAVFYVGFVDAFLNYEPEFECPDPDFAEMLSTVIYYDFALYNACAEPFEFIKHYDRDKKTVSIEYKYDKEKHESVISDFLRAADELLSTVSSDMTDRQMAQNIYHELCTRMTYDHSALTDFERKSTHYAFLEHSGVCITFANAYNQLLTQVGIRSTVAVCDYDLTMGHAWTMASIDGENYFFDPTFELNFKDGTAYKYFGMNYAERTEGGLGEKGIYAGRYFSNLITPDMIAEQHIKF